MIHVENLQYTYPGGSKPVLQDLSFDIDDGEIFGFLGPSGAGKSTTQKVLVGLLDDYEGKARLFDREVRDWDRELYQRMGVAAETPNLYRKLTGRENLDLFASLYGGARRDPVDLLERVGIAEAAHRRVGAYSKGMKMRLNFVRAFLHDPALVFLDEPTAGIDPRNAQLVKDFIEEVGEDGTTIFLTTHDMAVADQLCDRVGFIVDGYLYEIDTPRHLKLAHGQETVRVEYRTDGVLQSEVYELAELADDDGFHNLLRTRDVETIHSEEATLEDVFIEVTGEALR